MENTNEAVKEEEVSAPSTEQVVEQPQVETQEQAPEIQEPISQQQGQVEAVDERGVPWKNRAMELERKFNDVPQVVEQTVQKVLASQAVKAEPEYTIEQLEQYAQENPQYRGWAEARKFEILQKNIEKSQEQKIKAIEQKQKEDSLRSQSENWVVNHPTFKQCFNTDIYGNKVWNTAHPLTQIISSQLNQVDPATGKFLRDRPDGLAIAAKLAFADYSLMNEGKVKTQVQKLNKDLRSVQKKTLIEGQGVQPQSGGNDEFRKTLGQYSKTQNNKDLRSATTAYLRKAGILRDE